MASQPTPREVLEVMARTDRGDMTVWSPVQVRDALDAYRDQVLTEAAEHQRETAEALLDGDPLIPGLLHAAGVLLAARTTTAQEPPVRHCTTPNAQLPCGHHCKHDLCADCGRCCTCHCADTAQEQPR